MQAVRWDSGPAAEMQSLGCELGKGGLMKGNVGGLQGVVDLLVAHDPIGYPLAYHLVRLLIRICDGSNVILH